jgi:DNA-binding response OmpR family regulator
LYNVLVLTESDDGLHPLLDGAEETGLSCWFGEDLPLQDGTAEEESPQAVVLDLASLGLNRARQLIDDCRNSKLPVLVVVPGEMVEDYDPSLNPDEFILSFARSEELLARVRQAIFRVSGPTGQEILKIGDLVIDMERYEVTLAGRRVSLTYKEFQLLVMLASNPGRVYSREVLLSQVWGYDYLGGTRTVDVHVRRLRSKIEDPDHLFVETIWNVGYRFAAAP